VEIAIFPPMIPSRPAMLAMVEAESIDPSAANILRRYFHENRDAFWSDALADHGLL
jgi:hypothetical protein